MPNVFINCKCHLYADDTTIYCRAKTKVEAEKCLQLNLNKVSNWLHDNQLVVNVSKSNIMLVGTKTSVGNSSITASINGANLAYVSNIRLLGINIDNVLNWKLHIDSVCNTISSKVGLLHRLSRFLSRDQLIIIYTALIQSVIDYALTVWGSCYRTYLDTLQKIQNRCARICTNNFDYNTPSSLLLKQLKWMDIATHHTYFTGILMYKFVNGLLPPNLMNEFRFVRDIHTYPTRSSCNNNIVLPLVKTEFFKRALSYTGPVLWNSLPPDLRNSASANMFKKSFKCFLLCNFGN